MKVDEIKKKLKFAISAVDGIDKDYKIEAFKIIFSRELNDFSIDQKNHISSQSTKPSENQQQKPSENQQQKPSENQQQKPSENHSSNVNELITKLDVTKDELENVVSIDDDIVDIHRTFEGTDKQNMVNFAECYLVTKFYVFKKEWIKTTEISNAMKKIGIEDKSGNLSKFLQDENKIFVKRGKRKSSEIKLLAPEGRKISLVTLKNYVRPVD